MIDLVHITNNDSPDWVVIKLVSEPRLEMYDLGLLIVVDCVFFQLLQKRLGSVMSSFYLPCLSFPHNH